MSKARHFADSVLKYTFNCCVNERYTVPLSLVFQPFGLLGMHSERCDLLRFKVTFCYVQGVTCGTLKHTCCYVNGITYYSLKYVFM